MDPSTESSSCDRLRAQSDARLWAAQSEGREAVVLIDPDPKEVQRVTEALSLRRVRFAGFTNPWRALAHIGAEPAAVIVVSAKLGSPLLTEVVTALREETKLPVLVAHSPEDSAVIGPAILAGGRPVLGLPYDAHELVRVVIDAIPSLPPPTCVVFGRLSMVPEWRDAHLDGVGLELSPLEFAVLAELVRRGGRTTDRDALITASWESTPSNCDELLAKTVKRLRRKFQSVGVEEAVDTVRGVGYRLNANGLGATSLSAGTQPGETPISPARRFTRTPISSMILRTS